MQAKVMMKSEVIKNSSEVIKNQTVVNARSTVRDAINSRPFEEGVLVIPNLILGYLENGTLIDVASVLHPQRRRHILSEFSNYEFAIKEYEETNTVHICISKKKTLSETVTNSLSKAKDVIANAFSKKKDLSDLEILNQSLENLQTYTMGYVDKHLLKKGKRVKIYFNKEWDHMGTLNNGSDVLASHFLMKDMAMPNPGRFYKRIFETIRVKYGVRVTFERKVTDGNIAVIINK
jgi:hypothetical protein